MRLSGSNKLFSISTPAYIIFGRVARLWLTQTLLFYSPLEPFFIQEFVVGSEVLKFKKDTIGF